MERVKTKEVADASSWIFNTHKIFKWIQTFISNHFKKMLTGLVTSPGTFYYGTQTHLECVGFTNNGGSCNITIDPGIASTANGDLIKITSQLLHTTITWPGNSVTRYLYLTFVQVDDTDSTYDVPRSPASYGAVNVHLIDSYTVSIAASFPSSDDMVKIAKIVIDDGGGVTITDERVMASIFGMPATAMTWVNDNYLNLDKTGTTENDFKVGVGGTEFKLMREFVPQQPQNFKIYDINPNHESQQSPVGRLWIRWNWPHLTGAPVSGQAKAIISGSDSGYDTLVLTQIDEVKDFYLYSSNFDTSDKRYLITASTITSGGNTTLTLQDYPTDQSETFTYANIICGGSEISIRRTRYDDGNTPSSNGHDKEIIQLDSDYDVNCEAVLPVNLGQLEKLHISAGRFGTNSGWEVMKAPAAADLTYDPDHGIPGDSPQGNVVYLSNGGEVVTMNLPSLYATASLECIATDAGFAATITGWTESGDADKIPHEYELAYNTGEDPVDWGDPATYTSIIDSNRVIQVAVPVADTYQVSVRPIQNKKVVCDQGDEVHYTISSGGAGVAPNDIVILDKKIEIHTYSGTAAWSSPTCTLTVMKYPSGGTSLANAREIAAALDRILLHSEKSVLTDSASKHFYIVNPRVNNAGTGIEFEVIGLSGTEIVTAGAATINTDLIGRMIASIPTLPTDYKLTRAIIKTYQTAGLTEPDPVACNIFQDTLGGLADVIDIDPAPYEKEHPLDLKVSGGSGELNLKVDLYDQSSSPNNIGCVSGNIIVYGKTIRYVNPGDKWKEKFLR